MTKIKWLFLLGISFIVLSTSVYANEPSNWATEEINKAINNDLVTKVLTSDYKGQATRSEFTQLLVNTYEALVGETIDITGTANPFTDTKEDYIIKAYSKGFVKGKSLTLFLGNKTISREEIIVMIIRMNKAVEAKMGVTIFDNDINDIIFADQKNISEWALEDIQLAHSNGIVAGYDDGTIQPKNNITKEQVIIMNYRAYEKALKQMDKSKQALKDDSDEKEIVQDGHEEEVIFAYVTCDILNFRSSPNTDSKDNIIGKFYTYEKIQILERVGEWYQAASDSGVVGYVHGDFIKIIDSVEDTSELAGTREDIVAYAKQFVGLSYVYGGNSLETGTDCSGFVQLIYKKFGYSINRRASLQAQNGVYVDKEDILPGDLVFYGYGGTIEHVAMYIGEGLVIHAGTYSTGVLINEVFSSWNRDFITIRRIVQ